MVDVKLFQALLAAARYHCRIIMVGDADPAPQRRPGQHSGRDFARGRCAYGALDGYLPPGAASLIVQNAHRIVEGRMPQEGWGQR